MCKSLTSRDVNGVDEATNALVHLSALSATNNAHRRRSKASSHSKYSLTESIYNTEHRSQNDARSHTTHSRMSTEIEIDFSTLLPHNWKHCIDLWLQGVCMKRRHAHVCRSKLSLTEDIPSFDYGGCVVGDKPGKATLYCKAAGVVAGVPFFTEVFTKLGCEVHWHVKVCHAREHSYVTHHGAPRKDRRSTCRAGRSTRRR